MMTTTTERRRSRLGFRGRVLGASAVLLVTATVLGLVVQRAVLLGRHADQVASSLDQERQELIALASGLDPATGTPFDGDVAAIFDTFLRRNVAGPDEVYVTLVDGRPFRTSPAPEGVRLDRDPELVARWAALVTGERGRIDTSAGPVEYLAVPLRTADQTVGVFVVGSFLQPERDQILADLRVEAAVSAVVLLLALGAAWVIAGRLLRPVRGLTDTARSITETDLARRIPVEGDDEVAELASTFNAMLDRLAEAFASQRAFVDDAGHELRTPITIVRGHLELMGESPEEREETVALVTDELDRMARIVDDLLLLAKAEQPDFVRIEPVELSDLTTELLVKARALGERAWILDACADGTALLDQQRISQAVLNLLRNAVEHTAPRAEVALGSSWEGREVRFWVRDAGTGIDPVDHERLFERFARGRGGRRSDGAGLGLAIVQAVAVGHGGRVELTSALGQGATFALVLPAPLAAEAPTVELPVVGDDDPTEELPWPAS